MILPVATESLTRAVDLLRRGRLVAFPTETVYGLGGSAESDEAVRRIYDIKGRPSNNPLIVHLSDLSEMSRVAQIDGGSLIEDRVRKLSVFWPGPLSMIVPRGDRISPLVSAGTGSVAVRIPAHPVALELLRTYGGPIAAPSANPSGYISPTSADHVQQSLGSKVDLILDGGLCSVGLESTVVSLIGDQVILLRPGAISIEALATALGETVISAHDESTDSAPKSSPGLLSKHYAPRTKTVFLKTLKQLPSPRTLTGCILFSDKTLPFPATHREVLSTDGNLDHVAHGLFNALRKLDEMGLDLIGVDECEEIGIGTAIMDRLRRAVTPE